VTHEEYRRYLESLGEADLLDEARRVARADLGRWDMSPRYIAVWYACADRGMAAQFTAAVHEVRSGRRQQDADNRQRLGALGTTLSQGGHSMPLSPETETLIQAAFDAQQKAADADEARQHAADAALQAVSDSEDAEKISLAAHKAAIDAANAAIAALMRDLGVEPPQPPARRKP